MRELTVELFLVEQAAARGGIAIKHGVGGLPDRIVVIRGKTAWCEVKRPGEKPRPLQEARMRELRAAGARVAVVDTHARVLAFLDALEKS